MYKKILFIFFISFSFLPSCGAHNANVTKAYLNYKYVLRRAGDLHGLSPTSNEVLDRNPGFTSYIDLFNKTKSIINFQCKGTSYDDFYCEASFYLYDNNDRLIINVDSFDCFYSDGQSGIVVYLNDEIKDRLGIIYVYTPYWCRWQFEYCIDDSGDTKLLTFEFWKESYNQLPGFLSNE